jgi:hypothetical protein
MPRSLSNEQRRGIVDRLRNNKRYGLSVALLDEDVDASNYARDLAEVLGEGGWVVSGPFPSACSSAAGILMEVNDFSRFHPGTRLLVDVLAAAGIKAKVTQATDIRSNHYYLIIGAEAS